MRDTPTRRVNRYRVHEESLVNNSQIPNLGNYQALASAIVETAARDYMQAVRVGNRTSQDTIERFFRSQEYYLYTGGIDPEWLIKNLKARIRRR